MSQRAADRPTGDRREPARAILVTLAILLGGLLLTSCQSAPPGERAEPNAQEQGSGAPAAAGPDEGPAQDENSGSALTVKAGELVGRWKTASEREDAPSYRYVFEAEGTFSVYGSSETLIFTGDYEIGEDGSTVRLQVRGLRSDDPLTQVTMRPVAKRGNDQIIFEVMPRGELLWLVRQEEPGQGGDG